GGARPAHPPGAPQHGVYPLPLLRLRQSPDVGPPGSLLPPAGVQAVRGAHRKGGPTGSGPAEPGEEGVLISRETVGWVSLRSTHPARFRRRLDEAEGLIQHQPPPQNLGQMMNTVLETAVMN